MSVGRLARRISQSSLFRHLALRARDAKQRAALRKLSLINSFDARVLSQNGEDGILKELFARIPHNRFFIEIGVEDGSQCNSALLARHYGWRGIMIEADPEMFVTLRSSYADLPVTCVNAFVDRDNVVPLLEAASAPLSPDLMSIDIDGNDYYVWEATASYRPSVVIVEYNASFGPTTSRTIEYNPSHAWRHDRYYGASLAALEKLARRLGYALIGTDRRGVNGFFIRRDLLETCGFPERTPAEAWRPNPLISLLPNGSGPFVEP